MNTGIRRFILRLAVGLLTFLIGVSAVWALGGFNPFQSSSGTRYYRQSKRCGHYRSWANPQPDSFEKSEIEAAQAEIILLKGPRGLKVKRALSELPPPPPPPSAPMAQR
jgi:hypothetical protein